MGGCPALPQDGPPTADAAPAPSLQPAPKRKYDSYVKIRAEAEAPFRSFRIVIFGFMTISAMTANLFSLPQIAATLAQAPNAKSPQELVTDIAINLVALGLLGWLTKRDVDARELQLARVQVRCRTATLSLILLGETRSHFAPHRRVTPQREEDLGALTAELATGKRVRVSDLRGFCRPVLVIGTPAHVEAALEAAKPFQETLLASGVCLFPLPVLGDGWASAGPVPRGPEDEDKRWRATPLRMGDWKQWVLGQLETAGKSEAEVTERGLFVGLRLDGRVRSSGVGMPPFERYSYELAPVEGKGAWGGLMDGFDGRVSMFQ